MNWEDLKTKVEVVNKLITTLAIAAGAVWALYTFNGELRRENANAQLQKITREIEAQKREVVEAELDSKVLPQLENEYHVEVKVIFHNKGGIDIELPVQDSSLRITPIKTPELPDQPQLKRVQFRPLPLITDLKGEPVKVNSLILPAGGQNSLLYLAQVNQPGRFLVEFSTSTPHTQKNERLDPNMELTANEILDVPQRV